MRRLIFTGILAVAIGVPGLLAQNKKGQQQAQPAQAPAQPAQPAQPAGPAPKSQGEMQALQAVFQAQNNPDEMIKAVEDLVVKFPDTDFKSTLLLMEARAFQQKGDATKAQLAAERAVDADPKNYQANLTLGQIIAQHTRENDLDREEKLGKAEKLLNGALEDLKTAPKPNPQLTDEQWASGKKYLSAEAHNGLGLAALTRKKYDAAAVQFTTAYGEDPQPAYEVRLASAQQQGGKYDEAIATCDKVMAEPNVHPQIKQIAQTIRAQSIKSGGKATNPPAAAPAPAPASAPAAAPAEKKQ
jgi:tetratricopeptide (TPR) repeat protein